MNQTDKNNWTTVKNKKSKQEKMSIDVRRSPTKKAIQPTITKKTMVIEPDLMGFVIGREATNLKLLKDIYGVKISLPPRGGCSEIILEGPAEMVSAAMKDIEDKLSCKTNFFIEKDYTSHVVGPKGEKKRALEDALGVNIDIKEDGHVVVTGSRCEEAKKAIEDNLLNKTRFSIEKDYIIRVVGPKGDCIRALQDALSVIISIKEDGQVYIAGKESAAAKSAIESTIEKCKAAELYEKKFSIPTQLIGGAIGKDGSNKMRIENAYNVRVIMAPAKENVSEIIVKGPTAEMVSAAKEDILENLGTILDVDERLVGLIIGRGGERVRRLEKKHDVAITVGQRDGKAYILGKKDRIEAAREAINSIISEASKKTAGAIDESP